MKTKEEILLAIEFSNKDKIILYKRVLDKLKDMLTNKRALQNGEYGLCLLIIDVFYNDGEPPAIGPNDIMYYEMTEKRFPEVFKYKPKDGIPKTWFPDIEDEYTQVVIRIEIIENIIKDLSNC